MTEILDPAEIGTVRIAHELHRGDHVRLVDGRWALLLADPARTAAGKVAAMVSIEMTRSEWTAWRPEQRVFSRTPAEQIRHVETVFAKLRADGGAA